MGMAQTPVRLHLPELGTLQEWSETLCYSPAWNLPLCFVVKILKPKSHRQSSCCIHGALCVFLWLIQNEMRRTNSLRGRHPKVLMMLWHIDASHLLHQWTEFPVLGPILVQWSNVVFSTFETAMLFLFWEKYKTQHLHWLHDLSVMLGCHLLSKCACLHLLLDLNGSGQATPLCSITTQWMGVGIVDGQNCTCVDRKTGADPLLAEGASQVF